MRFTVWVLAAVAVAGCFGGGDDDEDDGGDDDGGGAGRMAALDHLEAPFRVEVPGTPVAIAPLPFGGVLVATIQGAVYQVDANDSLVPEPVVDLPAQEPTGEKGLLGLAVAPARATDGVLFAYAFFTDPAPAAGPETQRVVRWSWFEGMPAADVEIEDVVTGLPASASCCHNGGRVAFDGDGLLYVGLGENQIQAESQNPTSPRGKILRYTATGEPSGVDADSPVLVSGLRNPFGLWIDGPALPELADGNATYLGLVVTDNGPSTVDGPAGLDEVNVFQAGDNGGWPAGRGDNHLPGHTAPLWHSGDVRLAPTGVVVPRETLNETLEGLIVWCNYNNGEAWALDPAEPDPQPFVAFDDCKYDAKQDLFGRMVYATDGALWFVP